MPRTTLLLFFLIMLGLELMAQVNLESLNALHVGAKSHSFDRNNGGGFVFCGRFNDALSIDTFTFDCDGQFNGYIYKVDEMSQLEWAFHVSGEGGQYVNDVQFDNDGNIIVVGSFSDEFNLVLPNDSLGWVETSVWGEMFAIKLDPAGNLIWHRRWAGTGSVQASKLVIDENNDIFLGGYYKGILDFDPGPGVDQLIGDFDVFFLKLDENGLFQWVGEVESVFDNRVTDLHITADGHLLIAGQFRGNTDFDPGPGFVMVDSEYYGAFLLEVDGDGDYIEVLTWVAGSLEYMMISSIVEESDSIYLSGTFRGSFDFNPNGSFVVSSIAPWESFILKLNPNNSLDWFHWNSGGIQSEVHDMKIGSNRTLIATGAYTGPVDFDDGPNTVNLGPNWGSFIEVLNASTGEFLQVDLIGELPFFYTEEENATREQIIIENERYFIHDQSNQGNQTISIGVKDTNILASASNYAYLIELTPCMRTYDTITVTACSSYTVPSGNRRLFESGTYQDTLVNASGCDSLLSIYLSVVQYQTEVLEINDSTLMASDSMGPYQWMRCNRIGRVFPIEGADSVIFSPTEDGHYAVIVGDSFCRDTSGCVPFTFPVLVGHKEPSKLQEVVVQYLTDGKIRLNYLPTSAATQLKLIDMTGRVIWRSNPSAEFVYLPDALPFGMYQVLVQEGEQIQALKVLKRP